MIRVSTAYSRADDLFLFLGDARRDANHEAESQLLDLLKRTAPRSTPAPATPSPAPPAPRPSPTADAHITEFPLAKDSHSRHMTVGPDGALWFTEGNIFNLSDPRFKIGRIKHDRYVRRIRALKR